jgi:uncharacterized membrane protein YfcA
MLDFSLFLSVLFVFIAYFLKGFSGFGPALVLIPTLSLIIDPGSAITAAAFFDMFAGLFLILTVLKQIDWKFVIPVTLLICAGAYPGAFLLTVISTELLKILIGIGLLIFITLLLVSHNGNENGSKPESHWLQYPVALFSGFTGGLIGITGPVLIIYLKLKYGKAYFRTQLISVFFFGAIWRFALYNINNISLNIESLQLFFMGLFMFAGLYYGHRIQVGIRERRFNQVVAAILLLPAINLLVNGIRGSF